MLSSLRSTTPLLAATVFLLGGVGLLHTLVALHGEALGFPVAMIGLLTSAYYAGFLAGTWTVPMLIHRIGHIRAFAFLTAAVAIVVLLQAIGSAYALWLLLRLLQGLLLVGLYTIIESWLNAAAAPAHRSSVFAIYMMLNLGAGAASQQFLHVGSAAVVLFCVVAILFCAAGLPVSLAAQRQPAMQPGSRPQLRRLWRAAPTALAASLVSGLMLGALWGLLPLYAVSRGLDAAAVGTYMTVAIAGGVALQWPLGRFSDRIDRRLALALISFVAAAAAILNLWFPGGGQVAMLVLVFAFGGMSFALYPIAVAHLVDYVERDQLVSASSTVLLVNGIGSALGPLLAGTLMERAGAQFLFAWFAVLAGALAAYALYRHARRAREVTEDNSFMPMVTTTPSALDLHREAAEARPRD
ncbi:MAG: MFS transporter [Xanthomonadales bacterium]|nr:MFS transporter [Xanthomonadales bacterium]